MRTANAPSPTVLALAALGLALTLLAIPACSAFSTTTLGAPAAPVTQAALSPQARAAVQSLLSSLDLEQPALHAVKHAATKGDLDAASTAILAHFRKCTTARWICSDFTAHAPDDTAAPDDASLVADALADVFTFQGVRGAAPRTSTSSLDWTHRGPKNDLEWALFFNRHFHMLPMVREYQRTRNAEIARAADAMMRDWITNRPVENVANERAMSASWRPMSTASRLLQVWPHVFFGFANAPAFSDETRLLMLASIPVQADHLRRHHRQRHNHTIKEMAGLAHAAAVWPEFKDAPSWRSYAINQLNNELERQFYPDGVHQELSAHYHRSALQYFVWVKDFEAASGRALPADFAAGLERAADYLAASLSPQGVGPLNNNGDLDANRQRIGELASRFERPDWLHVASGGVSGAAPSQLARYFPWAGQVFFRNGYHADAEFAFFDIGPWGAAHQHNDKLNLVVAAYGRELLADGGRYRYTPDDPVVAYLRSSAGHNVVMLDDAGQNPDTPIGAAPQLQAFQSNAAFDFALGLFDAGFASLPDRNRHIRAVIHRRNAYWLVVDRIETETDRRISAHWRFGETLTVVAESGDAVSTDAGLGNIRITPVSTAPIRLSLVRGRDAPTPLGWYSPAYNDRRPATVARYETNGRGVTYLAWVLTPDRNTPTRPTARLLRTTDAAIELTVNQDRYALEFAEPSTQGQAAKLQGRLTFTNGASSPIQSTAEIH